MKPCGLAGWLGAVALLGGCAGAPVPAQRIVNIPVAAPCVKAPPEVPAYEFARLGPTASDGDKILALARDWLRYRKYTGELEAVIAGCR